MYIDVISLVIVLVKDKREVVNIITNAETGFRVTRSIPNKNPKSMSTKVIQPDPVTTIWKSHPELVSGPP
ncbi:MAG TPA: hypothetical protein VKA27_01690 [Sunxiuqinia sp.]|nr:hypothetical protein [Sunxiuqinia sp.]